jgi:hypothetical protein
MSDRLVDGYNAVDRGNTSFTNGSVAPCSALGTPIRRESAYGEFAQLLRLNLATKLLAKFVGSGLDH